MELETATGKDVCTTGAHIENRTRSTSSPADNGRPFDFCLPRHPVSVNCLSHARMVLSVGRIPLRTLHEMHAAQ